jgi:23S rRNA pseudouridine1911/1915/1917 synthase
VTAAGGTISDPSARVKPGQTFAIILPQPHAHYPEAQAIALSILYEDDDLLVINKPAGMVVHPAPGHAEGTLVNALLAHCGQGLTGIGGVRRPGIVHRLDKDTSGLMVVAKTEEAFTGLVRQFAGRTVRRVYRAVVWGVPPGSGEIAEPVGRSRYDRKKMAVQRSGGKPALTRYRLVRRLGRFASVVECSLASGRTHQIRVHMAHIGHPVVGDPVYGRAPRLGHDRFGQLAKQAARRLGRQALHAEVMAFDHPRTGARLDFRTDPPNDINNLITELERL